MSDEQRERERLERALARFREAGKGAPLWWRPWPNCDCASCEVLKAREAEQDRA